MTRALLALLALSCAVRNEPPPTYGISPAFTEAEAEVIESVFDAFCERVGYCPERDDDVIYGSISLSVHIEKSEHTRCPLDVDCVFGGRNHGGYIVLLDTPGMRAPEKLWLHLSHEIIHYCHKGHAETGIMKPFHPGVDVELVIDDVAAEMWRDGCGE